VRVNGDRTNPLSWPNASRLRLSFGVSEGAFVTVERVTPIEDALVKFRDGNILTADDLNKAVQQVLFRQQELAAAQERTIGRAFTRIADLGGITIPSEEMANLIAQQAAADALLNDFRSRISDIDANGIEVLNLAEAISAQGGDIGAVNDELATLRGVVDSLLGGDPGTGIATLIQNETNARIAGDTALVNTISLIGAKSAGGTGFIANLNTLRVSPTETFAQRLTAIDARAGANEAAIVAEQTARADAISAEATARNGLAATLRGEIGAAVQSEATARVNADGALATKLDLLGTTSSDGLAYVLNESTVRLGGGVALGTRLSGIDARIGTAEAAIVSEQTARASADSSLASSLTALQSSLNGNIASVSTLQSTVNGLSAQYGVVLNVNGHITGFRQFNNGASGSFVVTADRFAIVDPNGGAPRVPFEVSGGVVRIPDAIIGSLTIGKLTNGQLNADMVVGTGRIIWDNGTHMKVAGVGFGSEGQFIEWFGPKMDVDQCSEANAITFLKTNGDAYFGGSLSAGTISNAIQTTLVGTSAVVLGPFATQGRPASAIVNASSGMVLATGSTWDAEFPPPDPYVSARQSYSIAYVLESAPSASGPWTQRGSYSSTATSFTLVSNAGMTGGAEPRPLRRYVHRVSIGVSATTAVTLPAGDAALRVRRTSFINTTTGQAVEPTAANSIGIRYTEE